MRYGSGSRALSLSFASPTFSSDAIKEGPVHVFLLRNPNFSTVHFPDEFNRCTFDDRERLALRAFTHHKCCGCGERVGDVGHRYLQFPTKNIRFPAIIPNAAEACITDGEPRHTRAHRRDATVGDHNAKFLYFVGSHELCAKLGCRFVAVSW